MSSSGGKGPGTLRRAYEAMTQRGNLGPGVKGLPRRMVTFTIDPSVCAPGVFENDIQVTLGSLTPAMELEAANRSKGEPTTMAFLMARMSIMEVDGDPLTSADGMDDFFWAALDQGGRQMVVAMFARIGTPDPEAMGKATATIRIH